MIPNQNTEPKILKRMALLEHDDKVRIFHAMSIFVFILGLSAIVATLASWLIPGVLFHEAYNNSAGIFTLWVACRAVAHFK